MYKIPQTIQFMHKL